MDQLGLELDGFFARKACSSISFV